MESVEFKNLFKTETFFYQTEIVVITRAYDGGAYAYGEYCTGKLAGTVSATGAPLEYAFNILQLTR